MVVSPMVPAGQPPLETDPGLPPWCRGLAVAGKAFENLGKMWLMKERDDLYGSSRESREFFTGEHEKKVLQGFPVSVRKGCEVCKTEELFLVHSLPGGGSLSGTPPSSLAPPFFSLPGFENTSHPSPPLADLTVMGETPREHGNSPHVMSTNTLAMNLGIPYVELKYLRREREKIPPLMAEGKVEEATEIRERLLDRCQGNLENRYFGTMYTRDHNPEERRFTF